MDRRIIMLLVFLLATVTSQFTLASENQPPEGDFVLIINADSDIQTLSSKELRGLFSLRRSVWSDGTDVRIVAMSDGHKTHKEFIEKQLKLFPYQLKRIWDRQIFSGSAIRPIRAKSTSEIIEIVGKTKGAIGYSPRSEIKAINNEQVKIITIN